MDLPCIYKFVKLEAILNNHTAIRQNLWFKTHLCASKLSVFCRTDRLSSSASAISGLRIFFNLGFVKSSKIRANCSGSMSSSDLSAVFFFWLLLEFGFPLRKEDEDWLPRLLLWKNINIKVNKQDDYVKHNNNRVLTRLHTLLTIRWNPNEVAVKSVFLLTAARVRTASGFAP